MLVEIAIGDAYGAGFEYAPDAMVRSMNDLSAFRQHPRHGIRPGCYTDDTQMSIAVAEAIIAGEDWTAENLARRFVAAFKRDPRQGYAGRFYDFLREVHDEREFLSRIRPDSDKSGGAMRACPVGVFDSIPEVIEKARLQAAITHNTRDGTNAAAAAALAAHYFIYRIGDKAELGSFLAQHLPGPWRSPWRGKVGPKGMMSVHAAVTALKESNGLSDLLRRCVGYGGDVDTVAAIALGAASGSPEFISDLPQTLTDNLEDGAFGRKFLIELDGKLMYRLKSSSS